MTISYVLILHFPNYSLIGHKFELYMFVNPKSMMLYREARNEKALTLGMHSIKWWMEPKSYLYMKWYLEFK